ncbi:interferon a3-like [Labrus mixtus]|uniref:interferon a3-like n=1 Tax=Labrus mixtus TaxID=508554 RepID=UPI0029C0458A|nr:interferon a3-like [Labrus mixtus]
MPSLTSLFLVLCSVLTPNLCCDWVRRFGHLNGKSLDCIEHMGGPLTEEASPVLFPNSLYEHILKAEVAPQLVFIRDSLKLISDLYRHDNLTSVTWDVKKLVEFQTIIHRQVEELNTCVSTSRRMNRRLRHYYSRLTRCTLDRTGGSAASWEIIRSVTKQHLHLLDVMMNPIAANRRHKFQFLSVQDEDLFKPQGDRDAHQNHNNQPRSRPTPAPPEASRGLQDLRKQTRDDARFQNQNKFQGHRKSQNQDVSAE